jgi:adenylate kinase
MTEDPSVILITGVPGVGKTTVSEALAREIDGTHIELSKLAFQENLVAEKDAERDTTVIDQEAMRRRLVALIEASERPLVIDGHYAADIVDRETVDHVFVLRRAPWSLKSVLESRGYDREKVRENVEAELLGVLLEDALRTQDHGKICEVDTMGRETIDIVREILDVINGGRRHRFGEIDWMTRPEVEGLLRGL